MLNNTVELSICSADAMTFCKGGMQVLFHKGCLFTLIQQFQIESLGLFCFVFPFSKHKKDGDLGLKQ